MGEISESIFTRPMHVLDIRYVVLFYNYRMLHIDAKVCTFDPTPPCKNYGRAKYLSKFYQFGIGPHPSYTFDNTLLDRLED